MKITRSAVLCLLSLMFAITAVISAIHRTEEDASLPAATDGQESETSEKPEEDNTPNYIRYIDFNLTAEAMRDALNAHLSSREAGKSYDWIDLLSLLATRYGMDFSRYQKSHLTDILTKLDSGQTVEQLITNAKLFAYYREALGAVLGGMVGEYTEVTLSEDGSETFLPKYGLRVCSPIAGGYYYQDYDDFGVARTYGYRRSHLGHDMMGSVGTPILAIESGIVTALGWNQYGGWRVGITSFDGSRYYYYAHLRRDHPYPDLYEGKVVNAGEVVGYLGMTGYSAKENVNNIDTPHLHVGLQIIFDPSQKDGWNQIWIDMYQLTRFLSSSRPRTFRNAAKNESFSRISYVYPETPD